MAHPWSAEVWANYWLVVGICLPLVLAVITTIWFTIGCWSDLCKFYRRLKERRVDVNDNGMVDG